MEAINSLRAQLQWHCRTHPEEQVCEADKIYDTLTVATSLLSKEQMSKNVTVVGSLASLNTGLISLVIAGIKYDFPITKADERARLIFYLAGGVFIGASGIAILARNRQFTTDELERQLKNNTRLTSNAVDKVLNYANDKP